MIDSNASSYLGASSAAFERMAAATQGNREAVDEAAQEFEAVMLTAMLKPIFESVEVSEGFGGGEGEEMWRGLLVEEYAKEMASSGGIGIADQVRSELLRIQESAGDDTAVDGEPLQ